MQDLIYEDGDIDADDDWQTSASTSTVFQQHEKITFKTIQKQYTLFLLEMREQHMLPQGIIQNITTSILNLFDMTIDLIEEKAKEENINEQQSSTTMISTNSIRKTIKKIEELITFSTKNEYQFIQSCKSFFDYTPPIENLISSKDEKKEYSYHVSIKDSLKKILEKDEMIPLLINNIQDQNEIMQADSDLMFSFRHGIRGNKINKKSFLIQLYVDGIGVTNPIGPRKGLHNITMVYFLLEDIPDIFRSILQCINLAAICYTNQIYFTFTTIAADNLAAHEVADFQETFSSGHFCRRCLISYENRLVSLADVDIIPRTIKESPTSSSTTHETTANVINDIVQETSENNDVVQLSADLTAVTPPISTNSSISVKLLPDPYVVPDLPDRTIKESPTSSSTTHETTANVVNDIVQETSENNDVVQLSADLTAVTPPISTNSSISVKLLPDPYVVPDLPDQVKHAITNKEMEKFEKLCNFRSIVIDAIFYDLKTNYDLIYPTKTQYSTIVNGLLNHLGVEYDTKKMNSWRESLISKFKRERQNLTPVTPLPTIQVEEDHFNVYLDWTFICSSKSIEESIAILIGLYSLMDLKFNTYRMAARFLYAYLINDQQKQPNNIRKIFKEHSIELVCMPISSVQHQHQSSIQLQHQSSIQLQHQSPSSVEQIKEINNNNNFFPDDRDDSVHDLVIDDEENDEQEININISTSKTILMKSTPKPSQKRKANHLPENTDLGEEENTPPRKKLTNSKRTKRH
ncbi:unnamed protein product [Rotaria sordida]|uniref:Uncharacterized protein n=1 Tax=Rotaria sordida TaxID=392033 RepID=A0A815D637_9BILA|nr:unnamed protein product [Rotaria sordida]